MRKISLICPVYNSGKYLHKLINSIIYQTHSNFECIFVDDKSEDNSKEIIQSVSDRRLILLENINNLGAQISRKKGFEYCSGDYVAFIDSDDYLHRDYLKNLIDKLEMDGSDLIMCNYEVINENNKTIRVNNVVTPIPKEKFPLNASLHKDVIMSKPAFWNKMFKYEFLKQYISFPELSVAQDLAIMPLLLSKGKISYIDKTLYYYRVIEKSISNSYDRRLLDIHKSFMYLSPLKENFYHELEFIAIGHYFYQISKALFIKDKDLRLSVYNELKRNLKCEYNTYKKNPYFKKRLDYRIFTYILNRKIIFNNYLIHGVVLFIIRNKWINKLIRKRDK